MIRKPTGEIGALMQSVLNRGMSGEASGSIRRIQEDNQSKKVFTSIAGHLEFIYEYAQGVLLVLASAPTADDPLLEVNEAGWYGSDIYWRVSQDTILKFTADETITVT